MLPVILVAVGAYLIGDAVLEDKKYAKGGQTKEKLAEYLVTLTDEDGFEDDVVVMAKSEDDALYQAEKIKGYESSENGVVMLTDFDGNKIEYAKGGELMSDEGDIPYDAIKKMQKIKINELNKYMPSHKYVWYDNNSKKFYFKDHLGRIMELKNGGTLGELDRFIKKNNISLKDGKMAKGGKLVGKQKNLDVNKNGKLDAEDFKMLRGQKMADGGMMDVVNTEVIKVKGNIMGTTTLDLKIKGMRKPQDFIVYPISTDQAGKPITIQSDTRFGYLDLSTGRGLMSQSHANGAYSYHFSMDKRVPFKISETDVQKIKEHLSSKASSKAGNSVIFSDNSGADKMAKGGMSQGYDDREDERLAMEHGKMSKKDLDSTHARRDDARFEERGKMAKGGKLVGKQIGRKNN